MLRLAQQSQVVVIRRNAYVTSKKKAFPGPAD